MKLWLNSTVILVFNQLSQFYLFVEILGKYKIILYMFFQKLHDEISLYNSMRKKENMG